MTTHNVPEGANTKLGLPREDMKQIVIAFDVDGTLRDNTRADNRPNERIRQLFITLSSFKNTRCVIWSGSGELYARQVARELGLSGYCTEYYDKQAWRELTPDIAIDDIQDTAIGQINLIVREK